MDSGSDRSSHSGASPGGHHGQDVTMKASPSSSPVSLTRPPSSPPAPPAVSTPQGMAPRCLPLPPPGLGLLNTLGGMVHHSPLDLMAVAHHHAPPRSYSSPPPISTSDPTANECKLVDYRGQKVAAFIIAGDTMLCLPQAFELFLKHLVGGLHTVYTKLKRLDIVPLVCNVEQVRILRGLGAIQPGVNRCKLLSCKDFDVLYRDCTTARYVCQSSSGSLYYTNSGSIEHRSSRPGRPPKRAPSVGLSLAASHLSHQLKKHRLENGDYPYPPENGHLNEPPRLEKSPLLANGYNHPPHLNHMQFLHHPGSAHTAILNPGLPPHHGLPRPDGSIIKGQAMPGIDALARSGVWENCRAAYEDIVKHLERLREERGEAERALALDHKVRDLSSHNGSSNGQSPVLNLSKSGADQEHSGSEAGAATQEEDDDEDNLTDVDDDDDKDQGDLSDVGETGGGGGSAGGSVSPHALNYSTLGAPPDATGISSTETLLRNIQGLLKVAADNARQQERQINYEKAELKMDVLREREVKDSLERQLLDEQKIRVLYQKRLKKERKARRRLQDQLELEMKRRAQLEEALKASGAPPEALRILSDFLTPESTGSTTEQPAQTQSGQTTGGSGTGGGTGTGGSTNSGANTGGGGTGGGTGGSSAGGGSRVSQGSDSSDSPTSYAPQRPSGNAPTAPEDNKQQWNYSGLDLINSGAAFWQNYSESLAQELELERKSRQQQHAERDVKSPLQESRAGYYKNSVLFSSAT